MRALVTGATGLVGQHLVKLLLSEGMEVTALGRNQEKLRLLKSWGADVLSFDLTDAYSTYQRLDKFANYNWFHVASAISGASNEVLEKVNIEGTEKLVQKAEEISIPKFVLISSISVYGVDTDDVITEKTDCNPGSFYGETKKRQEEIVMDSDLIWTIIRPPYIGGPLDLNFLEEFATRIEKSKMPTFSKDGIISYVDARDLANAILRVAKSEKATNQTYNVMSATIRHSELVNLLGKKLGKKPPHGSHYPYTIALAVGFFAEIWKKITRQSAKRGASRYRVKTLCRQGSMSIQKITTDLGFQPKYTIEQSIDDWLQTRQ